MKPSRKLAANLNSAIESSVEETGLTGLNYSKLKSAMEDLHEENLYEIEVEEEIDEATTASSSGSFEGPQIWAKNRKNWKAVSDKNFPKFGGKVSTYV